MGTTSKSRQLQRKSAETKKNSSSARRVFALKAYKNASLRKISPSHNLIWYHFGSKADLFYEVSQILQRELGHKIAAIAQEIRKKSTKQNFTCLVAACLDFRHTQKDAMMIINQNLGGTENLKKGPAGLDLLHVLYDQLNRNLAATLNRPPADRHLNYWCMSFSLMIVNFTGAWISNHEIIRRLFQTDDVEQWIEDFLTDLFFPSFKTLQSTDNDCDYQDEVNLFPKNNLAHGWKHDAMDPDDKNPMTKGESTRRRIVTAASNVFSKNDYDAASIRMVGKEGDIDFTLIHHYFKTKGDLFRAVAQDAFDEFVTHAYLWQEGLQHQTLKQGFAINTRRIVDYCLDHPHALCLILQNIARVDGPVTELPGFEYLLRFFTEIEHLFTETSDKTLVKRWPFGQIFFIIYYVGGSHYLGQLITADTPYRDWIREATIFILYPGFRRIAITQHKTY